MIDRVATWGREFRRPRLTVYKSADSAMGMAWNRLGGVPGTPNRGVTLGAALRVGHRVFGVTWARATVSVETLP